MLYGRRHTYRTTWAAITLLSGSASDRHVSQAKQVACAYDATAATDPMLNGIQNASSKIPWAHLYQPQNGEDPNDLWERALADMGLQVIQEPLP